MIMIMNNNENKFNNFTERIRQRYYKIALFYNDIAKIA